MPTRVDFRKLDSPDKPRAVCVEIERLYEEGRKVYAFVESNAGCANLDRLLWTFSQPSFVPHRAWDGVSPVGMESVLIGTLPARPEGCSVLVAADPAPMTLLTMFDDVVDFAETFQGEARAISRKRYAECRNAGMDMYFDGKKQ
ncbi:MAG TPA: DNA polymerase III subunit chi [Candidatus Brocadiia bacterium]|nr:DNA polymerase III subunit chi [Candidatus Brocadiia bacterium]